MNPTTTELIIQALLRYGPDVAKAIYALFTNPAPTQADWDALWVIAQKSYDSYVKPNG